MNVEEEKQVLKRILTYRLYLHFTDYWFYGKYTQTPKNIKFTFHKTLQDVWEPLIQVI